MLARLYNRRERVQIATLMKWRIYLPDEVLCFQGEICSSVLLVVHGTSFRVLTFKTELKGEARSFGLQGCCMFISFVETDTRKPSWPSAGLMRSAFTRDFCLFRVSGLGFSTFLVFCGAGCARAVRFVERQGNPDVVDEFGPGKREVERQTFMQTRMHTCMFACNLMQICVHACVHLLQKEG